MKETKFKQTEVGMIPSDWEVKPFKNVATLINGRAYSQNELLERGKYRVLRVGNFGTNDSWYYSNLELPEKMYCNKGDLLYCWSCTYGAYIWDEEKTIYHYHIWKIADLKAEKRYLQYILNNDVVQQMNSSNGSTMSHITKGFLENRLFAFPPTIEEQQRIANALSDVDTLIANLEKLIAKKKNIKQGAMQQLLTGKKRLPGFAPDERREMKKGNRHCEERSDAAIQSGYKMTEVGFIPNDWIVEPLANIANTASGGTPSRSKETFYKGPIKWFTTTELRDCNLYDSVEHISKKAVECSSAKIFPKDTLLMAMYGATIGKLGLLKCDAATNQACCAIFPKKTDVLYLYYFLLYNRENIIAMGCGAGQPNVSQEIVKKINIPLPPTVKEQTAIANVLSDMDTEIATLETKLAKYRKLKTGMMQQLLTGKIRLV